LESVKHPSHFGSFWRRFVSTVSTCDYAFAVRFGPSSLIAAKVFEYRAFSRSVSGSNGSTPNVDIVTHSTGGASNCNLSD